MVVTDHEIFDHRDENYQQSRSKEKKEEKSGEGGESEL